MAEKKTDSENRKQERTAAMREMSRKSMKSVLIFLRWILLAVITGAIMGFVMTAFGYALSWSTSTRIAHPWLLFLMPAAGVLIVLMYKLLGEENNPGTNGVLMQVQKGTPISFKTFPLIFVSTALTHLVGGSAGREGAALQIGGSISDFLGRKLHLPVDDRKILVMCGMSAAFAALFGTPLAAAVFAMEVTCVGVLYYPALVPCAVSAILASRISAMCQIAPEAFPAGVIPEFTLLHGGESIAIGLLCGAVSVLFCMTMRYTKKALGKIGNPYLRIIIASLVLIGLTCALGTTDYNGAGLDVIHRAFGEGVDWYAFLLKILFTAITLGAGFRGGEIVPTIFIGATFGCAIGGIFSLSAALCAAVCVGAVFCGATNCPIASLLICFELFGYEGMPYYLLAIAASYAASGRIGLYGKQQLLFSKIGLKRLIEPKEDI